MLSRFRPPKERLLRAVSRPKGKQGGIQKRRFPEISIFVPRLGPTLTEIRLIRAPVNCITIQSPGLSPFFRRPENWSGLDSSRLGPVRTPTSSQTGHLGIRQGGDRQV